jgi:hypothetical protein
MKINLGSLPQYLSYDRQKCFVAYSSGADWSERLKSICDIILPKFKLEPWYAANYLDLPHPSCHKITELIANCRYGIYDISSYQDAQGDWHHPRNVFIELGIAIALNRPMLVLRHSSNHNFPFPNCLHGIDVIEFTDSLILKEELAKRFPQWLDIPPDHLWLNRFCVFGNRLCSFRQKAPSSKKGKKALVSCCIYDNFFANEIQSCKSDSEKKRRSLESALNRFNDFKFDYFDNLKIVDGYQFLVCSHCQNIRSTPFVIYFIEQKTSIETFVSIGISIVLENLFEYKIPKIVFVKQEKDLPLLLKEQDFVEAVGVREIREKIKTLTSNFIKTIRGRDWQPRYLPLIGFEMKDVNEGIIYSQTCTTQRLSLKYSSKIPKLLLSTAIEELPLSARAYYMLKSKMINSVGALLEFALEEIPKAEYSEKQTNAEIVNSLIGREKS